MAEVYKFKVELSGFEEIIWRDIEITSVSSVAKLGYAILAAFNTTASHLFNIQYEGNVYEIIFDDDFYGAAVPIDPIKTKLSSLKLEIGDTLTMEYDYGASWEFNIELASVIEMKKGAGNHYPYVTNGRGKGIIEDTSLHELDEIIKKTDEDGTLPKIIDVFSGEEELWDYKDFDLEYCNIFFKGQVLRIQDAYEGYEY